MKMGLLNSTTDGHKEVELYQDATTNYGNYMDQYAIASTSGTYTPEGEAAGKVLGATKPRLVDSGDRPTEDMTFEYFVEKCNACGGIPCSPPVPRTPVLKVDKDYSDYGSTRTI